MGWGMGDGPTGVGGPVGLRRGWLTSNLIEHADKFLTLI